MPSWNEKAHAVPVVNVNLKPCDCEPDRLVGQHWKRCASTPILIPCPIPRSVTFTVVLWECRCAAEHNRHDPHPVPHASGCPARPIRVTCSIGGGTWAGSEVTTAESIGGDVVPHFKFNDPILIACRARWALVKALVLGRTFDPNEWDNPETIRGLLTQRDAVFLALAKVAGRERDLFDAQGEYTSAMDEHHYPDWHRDPESYEMPSQKMLILYVERLIEQVGALS